MESLASPLAKEVKSNVLAVFAFPVVFTVLYKVLYPGRLFQVTLERSHASFTRYACTVCPFVLFPVSYIVRMALST